MTVRTSVGVEFLSSNPSRESVSSRSDRPFSHMMAYLNRDLKSRGFEVTNIWSVLRETGVEEYAFQLDDVVLKKLTYLYIPKKEIDGFSMDHNIQTLRRHYFRRSFEDEKKIKVRLRRKIRV